MTLLRDLLIDSRDGEWGKGESFDDSQEVSIIRGTDFASARIGDTDKFPIRHLGRKYVTRKALQPNDIIIETAGGTKDQPTGRTLFVSSRLLKALPRPAVAASFARFLRIDAGVANSRFVFWLLQYLYESRSIYKYHTQHTGVARFQFTTFADNFEFDMPSRSDQNRIADILSAYDDLIEVNQRRIAILEEMARRLFDEWFVDHRFPGFESLASQKAESGGITRAREIRTLSELVTRRKNGNVYKQADVSLNGDVIVVDQSTQEYLGFHFNAPDHFASVYAPMIIFGDHTCKLQLMSVPFSIGPNTIVFHGNDDVSTYYLYSLVENSINTQEYKRHWSDFTKKTFEVAEKSARDVYHNKVAAIFGQIETLKKINRNLRNQRDLLLPKLISGEIDVSRAEASLAEAAE